jgi:hypothetical protein
MNLFTVCQICGGSPAAQITLRRGVGMVVVARTYTADAMLCDNCASVTTKEYQSKTALQGWTSPRSALSNPVFLALNAVNRAKHKKRLRDS